MKIVGLGTLVALTAAPAHAGEKLPKCFDANREGQCVAALTGRVSGSKQNWDCHSFFVQVAE